MKGAENPIMILWLIAAFTAYFVKGLCGFANGLIFTTILGFGAPNANISPVNTLLGYYCFINSVGHFIGSEKPVNKYSGGTE